MATLIPRLARGVTRGVTRNLKNYGNINKFVPVYDAQPIKRQITTATNIFFNQKPKIGLIKPEPIKKMEFKNETLNDLFKLLTDNITNKVLIGKLLLIFSLASGVYMNVKNKPIIEEEKQEEEEKEIIIEENNKIIDIIKNIFNNLIEKIKNLELYKIISENFNKFIKLPNINYNYLQNILENINKIKDEKIYYQTLIDLNNMFSNIIIKKSNETKELIYSFKNKIDNYILHVSTEMKNKAINNFNIFLKLFELPNINRFNLLQIFKNYLSILDIKLIRYNVKQLINQIIKENNKKDIYIKNKKDKFETDNISEKELKQIDENLEKIRINKQFNYTNDDIDDNDDNFNKIQAIEKENFYDYLNYYLKKNVIAKKQETIDYIYNYFKDYFTDNNYSKFNDYFNKEDFLQEQIKKTENVKMPKYITKSLKVPLNINEKILNDLEYFNIKNIEYRLKL